MLPERVKESLGTFMMASSHKEDSIRKFAKLYCVLAGYSKKDLPIYGEQIRTELDNTMFDILFNKNKLSCILTIKKYFPSFRLGSSRRQD